MHSPGSLGEALPRTRSQQGIAGGVPETEECGQREIRVMEGVGFFLPTELLSPLGGWCRFPGKCGSSGCPRPGWDSGTVGGVPAQGE